METMKRYLHYYMLVPLLALCIAAPTAVLAQQSDTLTLDKAVEMALTHNHLYKITKLRIGEQEEKSSQMKKKYLASVQTVAGYLYSQHTLDYVLKEGSVGTLPLNMLGLGAIPLPTSDLSLLSGPHEMGMVSVMGFQPITQLWKIKSGADAAGNDVDIARAESEKAALALRQGVEKLYYGMLITQKQVVQRRAELECAEAKLADIGNAVAVGKTTESNEMGLRASAADAAQNLLKTENQLEDLTAEFRHVTGMPEESPVVLAPVTVTDTEDIPSQTVAAHEAESGNTDLRIARYRSEKAGSGLAAAWKEFIPDVTLTGMYTWQPNFEFLPKNNWVVGAMLSWTVWDWGSRKSVVDERRALTSQAEENAAQVREDVRNDVDKKFRNVKHSIELLRAAGTVLKYREEEYRIQTDRHESGLSLTSDWLNAKASYVKADADYLAAYCNYRMAVTDLQVTMGR
jgi:outer membrane protein